MAEPAPVDLIHLADTEGNRCVVRVTGRFTPGVLTGHDILSAEVLASASFVDARLDLHLSQRDLDTWQRKLRDMVPGREAGIGGDRGASLVLRMHEDGSLSATVDDPDRLTALLAIRPEGNWVDEHHERLEQVRLAWPREVVETTPGAYEWSTHRQR